MSAFADVSIVAHFNPVPAVESACKYCPLDPTPSQPTVSAAVPTTKSPLASTTD
jgi:hypothetical protein